MIRLGLLAGPLYVAVGLAQILARDDFDVRRHALSHLAHGEHGWIQTANFLLTGALVVAGALGLRVVSRGPLGPALLSMYGLGLVAAGVFPADPPVAAEATTEGVLHFAAGGLGFLALAGACFWFARAGSRGWRWFSALAGVGLLAGFAAVGAAPLALYAAVALTWAWHFALHARALAARA